MKPFSVAYRETKEDICKAINDSGLPIEIVACILRDLLVEAEAKAEMAYKRDLEMMKQEAEKEKEEEKR